MKKRSFPARRPGIPGRDPEIGRQPGYTLAVSGRFVKAGRPGKQGRFVFGAGPAVSFETLRTEVERVGLALPRERRLDSALCFPSRHGLGVAWTRVEDHPPKAPGLGLVAPLLGQNGEVPQGQVAVDAPVDAAELVGTLRCCSGITPERRGSLPMSLLPLRDCGFAGRNSVMSLFPSPSGVRTWPTVATSRGAASTICATHPSTIPAQRSRCSKLMVALHLSACQG